MFGCNFSGNTVPESSRAEDIYVRSGWTTIKGCEEGYYGGVEGSALAFEWPVNAMGSAGIIGSAVSWSGCQKCASGTSSPGQDAVACIDCSLGQFTPYSGAACFACNAGKISSAVVSSCSACIVGKYNEIPGDPTCLACSEGKFLPTTGSPSQYDCQSCSPGYYASASGSSGCSQCLAGTYTSGSGTIACEVSKRANRLESKRSGHFFFFLFLLILHHSNVLPAKLRISSASLRAPVAS